MTDASNVLNQTTVSGIKITSADTGEDGIRVAVVQGECFGRRVEWYPENGFETTAEVVTDPETDLPMLILGDGLRGEYRGLEANGVTWWRYAHEIDPNEYREHCVRIVRKI